MDEMDTWNTDKIVCPWCGYVFGDSCEYDVDDGELIECPECEKPLELELEYSASYYTQKPDWLKQWRRWNEQIVSDRLWEIERQARNKQ